MLYPLDGVLQVADTTHLPIFIGMLQQLVSIEKEGSLTDFQWRALDIMVGSISAARNRADVEVLSLGKYLCMCHWIMLRVPCSGIDIALGGIRNYRKLKSFRNTYKVCLTHPPPGP